MQVSLRSPQAADFRLAQHMLVGCRARRASCVCILLLLVLVLVLLMLT